jgi:hypothetical protein
VTAFDPKRTFRHFTVQPFPNATAAASAMHDTAKHTIAARTIAVGVEDVRVGGQHAVREAGV